MTAPVPRYAGLEARVVAFLFDTIILLAFSSVFLTASLFQLLLRSDFGEVDPPDSAFYTSLGMIVAVVPFWFAFNLWLLMWKGQSVGKYIVGIRVAGANGSGLTLGQAAARILLLDPLLFHPLLAVPWALLAIFATSLTLNVVVLVVTVSLALLSLLSPLIALGAMAFDEQRRGLHDRIAGTLVVRMA
ncbi:MAG: RDD family protein [Dehalococcoidia bacterium]|nr:RDD family protein [Dehalococcoidia bacterium]